jgi:hypothetical protein
MKAELRHPLEPWHVLEEKQNAGGIARYVYSSTEGLQTKALGWAGAASYARLQRHRTGTGISAHAGSAPAWLIFCSAVRGIF